MKLTVLTGDDEQAVLAHKAELLKDANENYERIDCVEDPDGILDLVRSPGLFAPQRFTWAVNFEALSDAAVGALLAAGEDSNAVVVARAGALSPKVRSLLKAKAEVLSLTLPKGKMVAGRVNDLIKSSGLHLDGAGRRILTERVGHDLDRLASVLEQCKLAGLDSPSSTQLSVLVGSSSAPGVPWDLSDALEAGDTLTLLGLTDDIAPMAAAAYLSNRMMQVAKLAEASGDEERINEILRSTQKFQADKLKRISERLGVERSREALKLLAEFDLKFKSAPNPQGEFDLLLERLSSLFQNSQIQH